MKEAFQKTSCVYVCVKKEMIAEGEGKRKRERDVGCVLNG